MAPRANVLHLFLAPYVPFGKLVVANRWSRNVYTWDMRFLVLPVVCLALCASCRYTRTSSGGASSASSRAGTVQEQRTRALVAHWLANAKKLRAVGELQAAKLELLKAKNLDPRNEVVAAQLRDLDDSLGGNGCVWPMHDGSWTPRLMTIEELRARATVQSLVQAAQRLLKSGDRVGAVAKLNRAQQAIDTKADVDWGGLPEYVKKVRKQIESDRSR